MEVSALLAPSDFQHALYPCKPADRPNTMEHVENSLKFIFKDLSMYLSGIGLIHVLKWRTENCPDPMLVSLSNRQPCLNGGFSPY